MQSIMVITRLLVQQLKAKAEQRIYDGKPVKCYLRMKCATRGGNNWGLFGGVAHAHGRSFKERILGLDVD